MNASEHTQLINMFLGLCYRTNHWPNTLRDLGYRPKLIEPSIGLRSSERINPDVVAVSNRLSHVIITECKGGSSIDADQDDRYRRLAAEDLRPHVEVRGSGRPRHTVCYTDSRRNHGRLKRHTSFPFITFGDRSMSISGSFGDARLDKALCGETSLHGMGPPAAYYPFSPNDDDRFVARHVLRGIHSHVVITRGKTHIGEVRETAKSIFELVHRRELISSRHRNRLVSKIEKILAMLLDREAELRLQVSAIEGGGYDARSAHGLGITCDRLIEQYGAR